MWGREETQVTEQQTHVQTRAGARSREMSISSSPGPRRRSPPFIYQGNSHLIHRTPLGLPQKSYFHISHCAAPVAFHYLGAFFRHRLIGFISVGIFAGFQNIFEKRFCQKEHYCIWEKFKFRLWTISVSEVGMILVSEQMQTQWSNVGYGLPRHPFCALPKKSSVLKNLVKLS